MPLPVENEKELAVGGYQGIKKVRGLLVGIDVQDPPEQWENREKQVVRVDLEDCVILEMFGDEEPFELKDGKYNFLIPYTSLGTKPHQNSIYSRCWLASAKELGKVPSEFIGEYVTLEKQPRLLFDQYVAESDIDKNTDFALNEEGEKQTKEINGKTRYLVHVKAVNSAGLPNHYCFVADEASDSENIKLYIRDLVVGLNEKAALRKLLVDQRAKQYPTYKDALNNGTLAEELDLELVDGVFQYPVEVADEEGSD